MSDNVTDPNLNRNEHDDTGGVTAKRVKSYVWNSSTLVWDKETQPGGGSGGTTNSSNTIDATPVTQNITARDVGSTTVTTNANNQSVTTGSPTAGSVASFALGGYDSARIQVTGIWTGTLVAQISMDGGTTWFNQGVHETGTAYTASTFTANFSGHTNAAGGTNWRLQSTTAWTGTATVKVVASVNPSSVYVANNLKLSDSTTPSIAATIKAASTAPLATDPALVVSMSPNSISTTLNAELPDITGTFTNATQTTAVQATGLNGYDNVFVSINGTYTAATATFQGSDDGGVTWKNIAVAARTDSQTIESGYTNLSSIGRGWNINIQGFDAFQVLSSAVATGTVNVRISAESAPTNAGATVGVASLGDGTNNVNILKSDGTAAGQNAELVAGSYQEQASLSTSSTTNNDLLPAIDVRNYKYASVQILGTWTGTVTFQVSNDNVTFVSQNVLPPNSASATSTTTSNGQWNIPLSSRYLRIRVTTGGTGTVQGILELFALPIVPTQIGVNTFNGSATGSAVPANAFLFAASNGSSNLTAARIQTPADALSNAFDGVVTTSKNIVYNGATGDMMRSATAAANTTGTGLLGVGNLMFDGTNWQTLKSTAGVGLQAAGTSGSLAVATYAYNGSTTDTTRNNTTGVVIAAGATGSNAGVSVTTYNASKALINTNIASGAGTVVVAINGVTASGFVYNILTSSAFTGVGNNQQRIFPGATAATGLVANDLVPRTLQIVTTVVGTISYGIDYELSV